MIDERRDGDNDTSISTVWLSVGELLVLPELRMVWFNVPPAGVNTERKCTHRFSGRCPGGVMTSGSCCCLGAISLQNLQLCLMALMFLFISGH